MQAWNVLHAARWKYRTQKWRKKSPSEHHRTTLSGYIFATKARIDNRKKNLLSSNICPACPYNMVNFGLLAAEVVSLVWGTPANFSGFRVLAALLHSQTAALNRRRHLYSAGRPSRCALAHISSFRRCNHYDLLTLSGAGQLEFIELTYLILTLLFWYFIWILMLGNILAVTCSLEIK